MLRLLMCLLRFHGVIEFDGEVKECCDCLKKVEQLAECITAYETSLKMYFQWVFLLFGFIG